MSLPFGQNLSAQRERQIRVLRDTRRCINCQRTYTELDNMGTHLCDRYHPAPAIGDRHGCCGGFDGGPGCVPADHCETVHPATYYVVTSDDALLMAALSGKTLAGVRLATWHAEGTNWRIDRFDPIRRRQAMKRV